MAFASGANSIRPPAQRSRLVDVFGVLCANNETFESIQVVQS